MALRFGEQDGGVGFPGGLLFATQTAFISSSDVFGSGSPQAQSATVVGVGVRGVQDLGAPPDIFAGRATAAGVGEVIHVGTGALQAQSALVVGIGGNLQLSVGTGVLQAQAPIVVGDGQIGIGGTGAPQAQSAIVVGAGELANQVFGVGSLSAQAAIVAATGSREETGAGILQAGSASAFGTGIVIDFAVDYVCFLQPYTLALETLSPTSSYPQIFSRRRNVPTSVSVDWDSLVTYHAGVEPQTEVAYEFSRGKTFVDDIDD